MTKASWTSTDIAAATGGQATHAFATRGVSIDTRTLEPGELFVALKDVRDGHDFVDAAFAAGASGALVSRQIGDHPQMVVDDVLPALERLGAAARDRAVGARRAAVTGSVGKTSVKEMIARIFRAAGPAHWSVKSFNNHWGVPLTLARMPAETRRAVFEIGMSTPGEIAPRSRMVRPHVGLITKIAPAHLEGLGSLEGVADEKSDIFAGLEAGGSIALPADDRFLDRLKARALAHQSVADVVTFGRSETASARVVSYDTDGAGCRIIVDVLGARASLRLQAVGVHWAENAVAALIVAVRCGVDLSDAAEALSGYSPPAGRGVAETLQLPAGGTFTLIDDAYNANPESMRAALAALASRPASRRLTALGEMLEVGAASSDEHAALSQPILEAGVEIAFLGGAGMEPLAEALPGTIQKHWAVKSTDLLETVKFALRDGDALLIKGSNASGMNLLANELRQWSAAGAKQVMDSGAERGARES